MKQVRPSAQSHLSEICMPRLSAPLGMALSVGAMLIGLATCAHAESAETASALQSRVKAAVERNTKGAVIVETVSPTAIPGVYEIVSGQEVMYVDGTGRYGIDGRMVDMLERRDLTAMRLEQLSRIDFRALPLDLAIKTVRGSGKRVLAVFEDPACPVCRVLTKFIDQLPDVTVYTFMYPVVDPGSVPRAQAAWCAQDRHAAWSSLMRGGPAPNSAPCDTTGLRRIVQLGERLHINGTPTVFLANGRRLVGATPPDQFVAALDEASK